MLPKKKIAVDSAASRVIGEITCQYVVSEDLQYLSAAVDEL